MPEKTFYREIDIIIEFLQTIGINPDEISYEQYLKTIQRLLEEEKVSIKGQGQKQYKLFQDVIRDGMPIKDFCSQNEMREKEALSMQAGTLRFLKGRRTNEEYIEKEREVCHNFFINPDYFDGYCKISNLDYKFIVERLMPILKREKYGYPQIATILVRYFGEPRKVGKAFIKSIPNIEQEDPKDLLNKYNQIHKAFHDGRDIYTTPNSDLFVPPKRLIKKPLEWGAYEYPVSWSNCK